MKANGDHSRMSLNHDAWKKLKLKFSVHILVVGRVHFYLTPPHKGLLIRAQNPW